MTARVKRCAAWASTNPHSRRRSSRPSRAADYVRSDQQRTVRISIWWLRRWSASSWSPSSSRRSSRRFSRSRRRLFRRTRRQPSQRCSIRPIRSTPERRPPTLTALPGIVVTLDSSLLTPLPADLHADLTLTPLPSATPTTTPPPLKSFKHPLQRHRAGSRAAESVSGQRRRHGRNQTGIRRCRRLSGNRLRSDRAAHRLCAHLSTTKTATRFRSFLSRR